MRHALCIPTLIALLGCPDKNEGDSGTRITQSSSTEVCPGEYQVFVGSNRTSTCGTSCPEGAVQAYTDGDIMACHECTDEVPCETGQTCSTACGPGCEDDSGGCCPVNECVDV